MPSFKEMRFWKKTESQRRSFSLQQAPSPADPHPRPLPNDHPRIVPQPASQPGPSTDTVLDSAFTSLAIARTAGSSDETAQSIGEGRNLGINILHVPATDICTLVDIVFIHGLTGNSYNTWLHRQSGVHWPRDLVKHDIPNARVLSWGYDADVASFWGHASSNQLAEHARNLLGDLTRLRVETNSEQRPILFVVHSLGGLVIQKALCLSRSRADPHLKPVEASTRGIAFMGTPHNGSDLAAWGVLAARLVSGLKDVNVSILRTLERDSEVLRDTQDAFGQLLRTREGQGCPIGVTCFYEEYALTGVGVVVPKSSACLFGYDYYGIPNNHKDMPKFTMSSDVGYGRVMGELKRWTTSLNPGRRLTASSNDTARSREVSPDFWEIMTILAVEGTTRSHQELGSLHPKSFSWLWANTSAFVSWLKSSDRLFWVAGKPGSGKTTLMQHLVSDRSKFIMELGENVLVSQHFFRSQAGKVERSIEGLLRSLIHQLLTQAPSLLAAMFPSVNNTSQFRSTQLPWSNGQLKASILLGAQSLPETHFILVVDGLDEFDGENADIAHFIHLFSSSLPQNAKLCVSSRQYSEFQFEFHSVPQLEVESHTSDDIKQYIRERLSEYDLIPGNDSSTLAQLVAEKADGMFLWVRLAMDSLQRGWRKYDNTATLIKRLEEMPRDLVDFYQRILDEMDTEDKTEAIRMLVLYTTATEELSCQAFFHAWLHTCNNCMFLGNADCLMNTAPGVPTDEPSQEQALMRFQGRVYALTRSLVQISRGENGSQPGRFFLLHETVQSFVRQRLLVTVRPNGLDRRVSGNGLLLHACVHYMDYLFNRNPSWTWAMDPKDVKCWSEWENDYFDLGSVYLNFKDYIQQCQEYRWTSPANYPFDFGLFHYAIQNIIHHAQLAELDDVSESAPCPIDSIMSQFCQNTFDLWRRLYQIHDARHARGLPVSLLALAIHRNLTNYARGQILALPTFDGATPPARPLHLQQGAPPASIRYDYSTDPNYLLFQAAGTGNVGLAHLLLSKGARLRLTRDEIIRKMPREYNNARTFPIGSIRHWGEAALGRAIFCDQAQMVTFLLDQGALPVQLISWAFTINWAASAGVIRCRILSLDSISLSLKRSRVSVSRKSLTVRRDPASRSGPSHPKGPEEADIVTDSDPDEPQVAKTSMQHAASYFNSLFHAIGIRSFGTFAAILPFVQANPEMHPHLNQALIQAASGGDDMQTYVSELLRHGADATATLQGQDCNAGIQALKNPCYALVAAASNRVTSTAVIMALLQAGADPNFETPWDPGMGWCRARGSDNLEPHGRPIDILLEQLSLAATAEREEHLVNSARLMIKYGAKIDHDKWDTCTTPERKSQLQARIFPNGEGLAESALEKKKNDKVPAPNYRVLFAPGF